LAALGAGIKVFGDQQATTASVHSEFLFLSFFAILFLRGLFAAASFVYLAELWLASPAGDLSTSQPTLHVLISLARSTVQSVFMNDYSIYYYCV
jgi:hypothetical protein